MPTRVFKLVAILALVMARPAHAMPDPPVLKAWLDPFYVGFAAELTLTDRQNPTSTIRTLVLDTTYNWDTGFGLELQVPAYVADSLAGNQGWSVPAIGGNLPSEIVVNANYRLWGDVYDYVSASLGSALPIASDDNLRQTTQTMILLRAAAQAEWGWLRLNATITDFATLPGIRLNTVGNTAYYDTSNFIQYSIEAQAFVSERLSVFLTWNEVSPRNSTSGLESPSLRGADVIQPDAPVNRVRHVDLGFSVATTPFKQKIVFQIAAEEYRGWGADVANTPQWATQGIVRWLY